jgi:hypothetical protein
LIVDGGVLRGVLANELPEVLWAGRILYSVTFMVAQRPDAHDPITVGVSAVGPTIRDASGIGAAISVPMP